MHRVSNFSCSEYYCLFIPQIAICTLYLSIQTYRRFTFVDQAGIFCFERGEEKRLDLVEKKSNLFEISRRLVEKRFRFFF